MTPFELSTLEASRRVEVLPSEFKDWQAGRERERGRTGGSTSRNW